MNVSSGVIAGKRREDDGELPFSMGFGLEGKLSFESDTSVIFISLKTTTPLNYQNAPSLLMSSRSFELASWTPKLRCLVSTDESCLAV